MKIYKSWQIDFVNLLFNLCLLFRHRLEVNLDRLPTLATLDGSKRQFLFAAIQADTTIISRLSHVHMDSSVVFQQQFAVCQQFAQKFATSN